MLFEMIEAIMIEKAKSRAENFKSKIMNKCSYLISIMLRMTRANVREMAFNKVLVYLE